MAGDVGNGAGEAGDVFSHTPTNETSLTVSDCQYKIWLNDMQIL